MNRVSTGYYFNRRLLCGTLNKFEPLEPGKFRPFVYRNRQELDRLLNEVPCSKCGYTGRSKVLVRREGNTKRTAAREVFSSERSFRLAVSSSEMVCLNCLNDSSPSSISTAKAAVRVGVAVRTRALQDSGVSIQVTNTTPSMLVSKADLQSVVESALQGVSKDPIPEVSKDQLQSVSSNALQSVSIEQLQERISEIATSSSDQSQPRSDAGSQGLNAQ